MAAMLCPSCRKLISVDEPKCPYCGATRPGLWGLQPLIQRFFGRGLELVPIITIVCVALYILAVALNPRAALQGSGGFSLLAPSGLATYLLGSTGRFAVRDGQWLSLLNAIYLHGGLLHIFFNMMWLRYLGTLAEQELGTARFFIVFSLTGAAGFFLSIFFLGGQTLGASGSISGLLGLLIAFRRRRGAGGDAVGQQLVTYAVLFAVFSFLPGVDKWAHLGGFVSGYLLGMRVYGIRERPEGRNVQIFALVLLGLTVVGFIWSIVARLPVFLRG